MNNLLNSYICYCKNIDDINKKLNKNSKKIRRPNFPCELSENMVKFYLSSKNIKSIWKNDISGDLTTSTGVRIEVKCFSSSGPISFGPNENFDMLYIVDATKYLHKTFEIYEINLSNKNNAFANIKINKNETYKDFCLIGKRPRLTFDKIHNQLKPYIKKVCVLVFKNK
jgi:hypothetical protein